MNFGLFYDNRAETHCNVNPAITGNQPTGQMFGGYYVGLPPDQGDNWTHYYHNGALYSDPRISAYIGMGLRQMPGNVWWRSWRELPPPAPFADCQATDPDFSWQGQWPMAGSWQTYTDPQSGQKFSVWEGHYTYPGSGPDVHPDLLRRDVRGPDAERDRAGDQLGHAQLRARRRPHRRRCRSSTRRSSCTTRSGACPRPARRTTPAATAGTASRAWRSRTTAPARTRATRTRGSRSATAAPPRTWSRRTPRSSRWTSRRSRPSPTSPRCAPATRACTAPDGFFDAVNPTTGAVGHRDLVLDQSMIMAALDNALHDRALQRDFARDPVSWAAHTYLSMETMFDHRLIAERSPRNWASGQGRAD